VARYSEDLMKIIRFIASPDGGSHFVELDLAIDNASTDAWGLVVDPSALACTPAVNTTKEIWS
jgi:hypothetical protein